MLSLFNVFNNVHCCVLQTETALCRSQSGELENTHEEITWLREMFEADAANTDA